MGLANGCLVSSLTERCAVHVGPVKNRENTGTRASPSFTASRQSVHAPPENSFEKYNRFTMENPRQLQCKALRELEKSRRRKNNGKQWKKQCAKQWNRCPQNPASPGHVQTPQKQSPAAARRRAHISETRISAIAHWAARCTQNKKALPLFPHGSNVRALAHMRSPCASGEGVHAPTLWPASISADWSP